MGHRSFYAACVLFLADSAERQSMTNAFFFFFRQFAHVKMGWETTHLCEVGRCSQAWELLCGIDTEWSTVAFGPNWGLPIARCDAGEKVETAVS